MALGLCGEWKKREGGMVFMLPLRRPTPLLLLFPGALRDLNFPALAEVAWLGEGPLSLGWASWGREGLTAMLHPPPRSYLSLPAPHLGAGPLSAPLGTARCSRRSLGAAAVGEGRSGRALRRRGRGPGLRRGSGRGRKLPEQIRAEVGPAVRRCGTLPPPTASEEPAPAPPDSYCRSGGLSGVSCSQLRLSSLG